MGRGVNNGGKTLVLELTIEEANYIYETFNYTGVVSVYDKMLKRGFPFDRPTDRKHHTSVWNKITTLKDTK